MRLSWLLVLVVAGCVVPKRAGFDDVSKLVSDRGLPRIHWNQGTPEDEQVRKLVADLLQKELTPATAVEIALLSNPRLQATYERLGVAQAEVVQAGLLKNPTFFFGLGLPITAATNNEYEFSLIQDFLDLFLIPVRKRFARAEHEAVKLEVGDQVMALAADVRAAFYMVQGAQQILTLRRTLAETAQTSSELAARQHSAGNRSDLDLASQEALAADAQLDVLRAEEELRGAREHLTRLLGVTKSDWKLAGQLPPPPASEPRLETVEELALSRRLDVAAAIRRAQTAHAAISVARARVIGGFELGVQGHQDPDHDARVIGPSLRLELPIFDQKQAVLFRLRAEARQAEKIVDALKLEARSQVRGARDHLLSSRALVDHYQKTVLPLRERVVALSQQQYNAMLIGVFQLLAAKQAEVASDRDYIEAVRDYFIARAELERAAGGPIP